VCWCVGVVVGLLACWPAGVPPWTCDHHHRASRSRESASLCQTVLAATNKSLAQSNKFRTEGKATKKVVKSGNRADPMGAHHRIVPAIKQALSMLGQARDHCFSRNVPPPSPRSDGQSSQPRARFVPPSDAQSSRVARSVAHPIAQLPSLLATNGKR
jgi:hypothetical protein